MSTEESTRRPDRAIARTLGMIAGGLAGVSLAGCTGSDDDNDDPSDPGGDGTGDRRDDPTAGECDPIALEADRDALQYQIEDLRRQDPAFKRQDVLRRYRDQLVDGFSASIEEAATDVAADAREAVVIVDQLEGGLNTGSGTGWFVEPHLILTNAHNVHDGIDVHDLSVTTIDGADHDVEVVAYEEDQFPDVALLRTDDYVHDVTLEMRSEEDLETGQPLVQIGHPGGQGYWMVSMGVFVQLEEYHGGDRSFNDLLTLIPGIPGVSGSPVLTLDGGVVGMTWGGEPIIERDTGDPANFVPDEVFDTAIGSLTTSKHVGSDILRERLHTWQ